MKYNDYHTKLLITADVEYALARVFRSSCYLFKYSRVIMYWRTSVRSFYSKRLHFEFCRGSANFSFKKEFYALEADVFSKERTFDHSLIFSQKNSKLHKMNRNKDILTSKSVMHPAHMRTISYMSNKHKHNSSQNRNPVIQVRSFRSSNRNAEIVSKTLGASAFVYSLFKLKALKFLLPALKVAKMGPLLSMGISAFAYSFLFGWKFAAGMVGLIFIHELGHKLMMDYYGVPSGPMTFIPFFGAFVEMKDYPTTSYEESWIALAGPVLGSLATIPFTMYGLSTGSQFAFALANWGYIVNLFNLLPIGSLDGGRVAGALSKWTLPAGLLLCGGWIYAVWPTASPILYLVFLGGTVTTYSRFFGTFEKPWNYYNMSFAQRAVVTGSYMGLIGALLFLLNLNDKFRKSPRALQREMSVVLSPDSVGSSMLKWT